MSLIEDYVIPIHGLKEGVHEYEFEAKSGFFALFENPDIPGGDIRVRLELYKKPQFLELTFHIEGYLEVICDRCLDEFRQKISSRNKLFVRFGEDYEEVSENMIVIPRWESRINVAQYIYEFSALSLPVQNIHPEDEEGNSLCNAEMLKKLAEHSDSNPQGKEDREDNDEDEIDPRWETLKKLKDLN